MAAVSVWPVVHSTFYGYGSIDAIGMRMLLAKQEARGAEVKRTLSLVKLIIRSWKVFVTTYALFLMFTYCVFGMLHEIFVASFILALLVHWFAVIALVYRTVGKAHMEYVIAGIATVGIVAFVGGQSERGLSTCLKFRSRPITSRPRIST